MVNTCFKDESCERHEPNLIDCPALLVLPHLNTLPSTVLKQKYLVTSIIWMNYDTNKSAICHHKLANWELVNILEELKVVIEKNYGHWWWTKQYERKKEDKRKWTHNLGKKLANALFGQKKQHPTLFPKLIREMPLFYNSIIRKSRFMKNSIIL